MTPGDVATTDGAERRPVHGKGARFAVALVTLLAALGLAEVFFRAIGHNFTRGLLSKELAPCFLLPMEPIGEGLEKRRGPLEWTGRPLSVHAAWLGIEPNPYADEPTVRISYDAQGFRNPPDLADWQVVVAGDSFTELGFLPLEQLATTVLGRELGVAVKNLGVSGISTLTEVTYLEHFGLAPSTRHAVLAFFEGNDLAELRAETETVERWRGPGEEVAPRPRGETSFVHGLVTRVKNLLHPAQPVDLVQGTFDGARGQVPIAGLVMPPSALSADDEARLRQALGRFVAFTEEHGLTPWLCFVPCKLRVHDDHLHFTARALERVREWTPNDFPDVIGRLCGELGIRFVDLTPALVADAEASGELLYNTIGDTHWNARGAAVAGRALARAMREALEVHASR